MLARVALAESAHRPLAFDIGGRVPKPETLAGEKMSLTIGAGSQLSTDPSLDIGRRESSAASFRTR